jgi:hypothetical protein
MVQSSVDAPYIFVSYYNLYKFVFKVLNVASSSNVGTGNGNVSISASDSFLGFIYTLDQS